MATRDVLISNEPDYTSLQKVGWSPGNATGARPPPPPAAHHLLSPMQIGGKLFLTTHFESPRPGSMVGRLHKLPDHPCPLQRLGLGRIHGRHGPSLPALLGRASASTACSPPSLPLQYVVEVDQSKNGTLTPKSMKVGPAPCQRRQELSTLQWGALHPLEQPSRGFCRDLDHVHLSVLLLLRRP